MGLWRVEILDAPADRRYSAAGIYKREEFSADLATTWRVQTDRLFILRVNCRIVCVNCHFDRSLGDSSFIMLAFNIIEMHPLIRRRELLSAGE